MNSWILNNWETFVLHETKYTLRFRCKNKFFMNRDAMISFEESFKIAQISYNENYQKKKKKKRNYPKRNPAQSWKMNVPIIEHSQWLPFLRFVCSKNNIMSCLYSEMQWIHYALFTGVHSHWGSHRIMHMPYKINYTNSMTF